MRETARKHRIDRIQGCRDCDLRNLCGGTCRVINRQETGSKWVTTCTAKERHARYRNLVRLFNEPRLTTVSVIDTDKSSLNETPQRRLLDLAQLPPPDYEDFYASAAALGYPTAETVLPIEASRGCFWEHRGGRSRPAGCAFCGLNAGWPEYREKPLANVIEEIHRGIERYHALDRF